MERKSSSILNKNLFSCAKRTNETFLGSKLSFVTLHELKKLNLFLNNHLIIQLSVGEIHSSGHGKVSFMSSPNPTPSTVWNIWYGLVEQFLFRKL